MTETMEMQEALDRLHELIAQMEQQQTEVVHEKARAIESCLQKGIPVWLMGDAGTGKSFTCRQIAKRNGWQYFETGCVTDEYTQLKGFIDANGAEHGTQFTQALACAEAGIDCLMVFDEADGSIPEVLLALNSYLSDGVVECMGKAHVANGHMRIVACGNTNGTSGGSRLYKRRQLDAATLDRFHRIEFDYDERIELRCAEGDEKLAEFCRTVRKAAREQHLEILVSYRAITKVAKLYHAEDTGMTLHEILMGSMFSTLDAADREQLRRAVVREGLSANLKLVKAITE